jgi:hypothetical protein
MRLTRLFAAALLALPLAACAGGGDEETGGPTPFDDDNEVGEDTVNDGAPDNDSLPDDNKADAVYPAKFEVGDQSPVKSQGGRGVCSIFASTALIENVYIHAGLPVAEADYSEQYLQWAAKNLGNAFRNTEGSSSDANLRTVVNFGTIAERDWAYESTKWSAANDPACTGGENLPTKCYTNGEPPASVAQARKIKLLTSRWISTGSIKAHIFTKKTGVNVGLTFFYQSWNHRSSTIPVSTAYWQKGYVTYPNAKDQTESLAHRAGHAIHLVGWDDELEVCMRDGEGNDVSDGAGGCKKEKGFWIFKNSWGTAGFGINHPTGPGYGYLSYRYVQEYGSAVVAEPLPIEAPREVCDDAAEADEDNDGNANCDDSDCAAACAPSTSHTYTSTPAAAIPDQSSTSSTINVTDAGTIATVKLSVAITHTYRGDLKVTLTKGAKSVTARPTTSCRPSTSPASPVPSRAAGLSRSRTPRRRTSARSTAGSSKSRRTEGVAAPTVLREAPAQQTPRARRPHPGRRFFCGRVGAMKLGALVAAVGFLACSSPSKPTTQPPAPDPVEGPPPVVATPPQDAKPAPPVEDPYLWLEEVGAEKSLAWARERNKTSQGELEGTPGFAPSRDRIRAILDSKDKPPFVGKRGNLYYNFWKDAQNPKGLLRRTTLAEYKKAQPKWETVLDVDALAAKDKERWVYKGNTCLYPKYRRGARARRHDEAVRRGRLRAARSEEPGRVEGP